MSVFELAWRRLALVGVAFVAAVLSMFFAMAPATADPAPGGGTVDTSSYTVITDNNVTTLGDPCTPDLCKQIPLCPGIDATGSAEEAPLVRLLNKESKHPECVIKPHIKWECKVKDSKLCVDVIVHNPNIGALRIRVKVGSSGWIDKWVGADSTVTYTFKDVAYGEHQLVAQIKAGLTTWCEFKRTKVTCTSPSPSHSPSPSVSPSVTVSPSISPSPGGELPQTGSSSVGPIALTGAGALGLGTMLVLLARRRRLTLE